MTTDIALPPLQNLGSVRISRDRLDGHPAYADLLSEAPTSSCCPVWVTDLERIAVPDDVPTAVAAIEQSDPEAFMAARWMRNCPLCGCRDPFDEFPGLQPALLRAQDPVVEAARMAAGPMSAHLALVPVARPADTVTALGWTGPCNYQEDLAGLSGVLRSWEDRFGALVVRIDSATLWLSVAAPPRTADQCNRVAAEHFSFCRDVDWEDPRPLRRYASTLRGNRTWRFWWD